MTQPILICVMVQHDVARLSHACRYIADSRPQQLDKELVPALKNFAKATTKRLVKMGVAGRILVSTDVPTPFACISSFPK